MKATQLEQMQIGYQTAQMEFDVTLKMLKIKEAVSLGCTSSRQIARMLYIISILLQWPES